LGNCLLIIDDLKGRKLSNKMGLSITGTIGVIVEAKIAGVIPSVKPILSKIELTKFRLSTQLESLILSKVGE